MKRPMIIAGFCLFTLFLTGYAMGDAGSSEGILVPAAVGEQVRYGPALKNMTAPGPLHDLPISVQDLISGERLPNPPDDPCLPPLYKDWRELSLDYMDRTPEQKCSGLKIIIDRSTFRLTMECEGSEGSIDEVYETEVGLGDINSPTPAGRFVINHIYCYPDVVFFSSKNERVPSMYNGFFAPLLFCEKGGRCHRYQELGIHGFQASAHPHPSGINPETTGAVSAGCIRIPDPCRLKRMLISRVGIGDLHKDDRGFYYWLNRPVQVQIIGDYPGQEEYLNLVSVFEKSLSQVQEGVRGLLDLFSRDNNNDD
jgi:hypothetical protein